MKKKQEAFILAEEKAFLKKVKRLKQKRIEESDDTSSERRGVPSHGKGRMKVTCGTKCSLKITNEEKLSYSTTECFVTTAELRRPI